MKTLVVARHKENVDWAHRTGWLPLVVTKGVHVPNEGREGASFLFAMEKLYGRIGPFAFVQGNPFDHAPNLHAELGSYRAGFMWLGDASYVAEADGSPSHPGLPVRERYEAWTGKPWPGQVLFAAGGQFVIDGRMLRKKPRAFYRELRDQSGHGETPWVLERLWEAIFLA